MTSIYEDMRTLHEDWHSKRFDFYIKNVEFTRRFAAEFREYIGAPLRFKSDFNTGATEDYVSLVRVDPLNENEEYRLHDLKEGNNFDKHITEEKEDGFVFGLKVYVETAVNTYPKHPFWFRISYRPRADRLALRVFRTSFNIDLNDTATWTPVFDHLVERIRNALTYVPGESFDDFDEREQAIGFVHSFKTIAETEDP